jgi:type II secretory pathway pseudopilin PulG
MTPGRTIAPVAFARVPHAAPRGLERGFSLIIAMLMLAVIGLASAAIMRNATSSDQVAMNNRLQTQAHQYAQVALRFCENQLALAPKVRTVALFDAPTPAAWTLKADWTAGGSHLAYTLAARDLGSSVQPRVAPQCMVESTGLANVFTVTSRGFSADFSASPDSGSTRTGSVVWLQSTVLVGEAGGSAGPPGPGTPASHGPSDPAPDGEGGHSPDARPPCASGCAFTVRQRLWQQLLTPPF